MLGKTTVKECICILQLCTSSDILASILFLVMILVLNTYFSNKGYWIVNDNMVLIKTKKLGSEWSKVLT